MNIGYLMQLGAEIRQPPFNGPANHVRHVVQELQARGHEVQVLFRLDKQIWHARGLEQFEQVFVEQTDQGFFRFLERGVRRAQAALKLPYLNWFESQRFASACQKQMSDVDLLYERTSWLGYGGALAARRLHIPLVLEDNGDHLDDLEAKGVAPHGFQRWLALRLMQWGVHQANHVVSSGQGWRQRFIERWQLAPEKVSVVENGTTLIRKLARQDLKAFQTDVSAPDRQALQIVYLGGFYPWHGVPILLHAAAQVHQQFPHIHYLLIGAGEGLLEAQQLTDRLGIKNIVTFTGHCSQAQYGPMLANADIGVSPYCGWPEFSGLKIFDYKAAGLPTIASGVDGNPTTITHGKTGWIVPPCSQEALAEAILGMASNPARLRAMGRTSRLEAETQHDWQHTVQRLETIFQQILID